MAANTVHGRLKNVPIAVIGERNRPGRRFKPPIVLNQKLSSARRAIRQGGRGRLPNFVPL